MINDVDLKEIEGHESEKVNKTSIACVAIQTMELERFYGKIWKESEGDGPGGVLPYMAYTGMCRLTGSGFWPLCPKQGM